jgi:hypothetical protein
VRERPRRLGAEAVYREGEVAPPELRREPTRRLDHPTELPHDHLHVRRREVGTKRSLRLCARHELFEQWSDALSCSRQLRLVA